MERTERNKTPMDWYLGKKSEGRSSIDNAIDDLDEIKIYFPSKGYRNGIRDGGKRTGTLERYFPAEKYLNLRRIEENLEAERRDARNQAISAAYNNVVVPVVKTIGKGLYKTGYYVGKRIGELGLGALYVVKKVGETAEKAAEQVIDARLYERLNEGSKFAPKPHKWYEVHKGLGNIYGRIINTLVNAEKYRDLKKN
ncbi:MAG: hypothetical protein QW727_00370 [Candidatus Pacearchaeota archaeon]